MILMDILDTLARWRPVIELAAAALLLLASGAILLSNWFRDQRDRRTHMSDGWMEGRGWGRRW